MSLLNIKKLYLPNLIFKFHIYAAKNINIIFTLYKLQMSYFPKKNNFFNRVLLSLEIPQHQLIDRYSKSHLKIEIYF